MKNHSNFNHFNFINCTSNNFVLPRILKTKINNDNTWLSTKSKIFRFKKFDYCSFEFKDQIGGRLLGYQCREERVWKGTSDRILQSSARRYALFSSTSSFKFGDVIHQSLGILTVRIPTPRNVVISVNVDVVDADILLMVGLRDLKQDGLLINYSKKRIKDTKHGCHIPITYKSGHILLTWNLHEACFTRQELLHSNLHFLHLTAEKLINLLRRAYPASTDEMDKDIPKQIAT